MHNVRVLILINLLQNEFLLHYSEHSDLYLSQIIFSDLSLCKRLWCVFMVFGFDEEISKISTEWVAHFAAASRSYTFFKNRLLCAHEFVLKSSHYFVHFCTKVLPGVTNSFTYFFLTFAGEFAFWMYYIDFFFEWIRNKFWIRSFFISKMYFKNIRIYYMKDEMYYF